MFLAANPDRARPQSEKDEIAQKYRPGDSVFPSVAGDDNNDEDEDDTELDDREPSLEEQGSSSSTTARHHRHHHHHRTDGGRRNEVRNNSRRRHAAPAVGEQRRHHRHRPPPSARDPGSSRRQIERQSSLRSLVSLSDDPESVEEEILREIFEGGLLDGIDLDTISSTQEEELSERIADAFRQRHLGGPIISRQRQQLTTQRPPSPSAESTRATVGTRQAAARSSTPPRSLAGHRRGVRSSSRHASSSDLVLRPAARSANDIISDRVLTDGRRSRRATESDPQPVLSSGRSRDESRSGPSSSSLATPRGLQIPYREGDIAPSHSEVALPSFTTNRLGDIFPNDDGNDRSAVSTFLSPPPPPPPAPAPASPPAVIGLYSEPSISCGTCGKADIQYEVYKNCSHCNDGNHNVCLRCYRLGGGCSQWHMLPSFRYSRPSESAYTTLQQGRQMTDDDPSYRLQTGLFCDRCQASANDCFWKCDHCNDADWGFCGHCVNQGKCCTHPLLPICLVSNDESSPVSSRTAYKTLSVSTTCDICTSPIAASMARFHCLECNAGDYDICVNCYFKLVASGKITKENGHSGWRRCPAGHRMEVVGFESYDDNDDDDDDDDDDDFVQGQRQRRIVIRALVGGHALKDDHVGLQGQSHYYGHAAARSGPELGNGDWSWKEGSERRKKASRIRTMIAAGRSNSDISTNNSRSSSGSSSNTAAIGVAVTTSNSNIGEYPQVGTTADTTILSSPPQAPRRFPPDGGVGLIVRAQWSWLPEADAKDELLFPHGADITEAENINDDWFWGCYAGQTGLFPGGHVVVIGEVGI